MCCEYKLAVVHENKLFVFAEQPKMVFFLKKQTSVRYIWKNHQYGSNEYVFWNKLSVSFVHGLDLFVSGRFVFLFWFISIRLERWPCACVCQSLIKDEPKI